MMRSRMTVITWVIIFLIAIQTTNCDLLLSRNYRRNIRDDSKKQVGKFDLRQRVLEKKKLLPENSFIAESDDNTDLIRNYLKPDSIISLSLTDSKYGMASSIRKNFRTKERSMGRISNRLPKKNENRMRLPQNNNVLPAKSRVEVFSNADSSFRMVEPVAIRYSSIQRNFRNDRENRQSDDGHIIRERTRTNRQRRTDSRRKVSVLRIRNSEILKMAKIELPEFINPSVRREVAVLYRVTRFSIPTRFSTERRERNAIRQQNNRFERYFNKNRLTINKLQGLRFDDSSFERNTGSKLQQPRYERHLLVPKRELKIPLEKMSGMDSVRRSRISIRNNALDYGNVEGNIRGRRDGRGLTRTMDQRMNVNKSSITKTFEACAKNQAVFTNYGRNVNQKQNRRNDRNSRIASSADRHQNRDRLDSLKLSSQRKEVLTRKITTLYYSVRNYNVLSSNAIDKIRFDSFKGSYRRQDRRSSSSQINSSDRRQSRGRLDSLQLNRQRKEMSTTSNQPLKTYNALSSSDVNRIRFDNPSNSYRFQERRINRRATRFNSEERIVLDNERKTLKETEREEIRTNLLIRNKVILSSKERLHKRIAINRNRSIMGNGENKLRQNLFRTKQQNALVTDVDKIFTFKAETGLFSNERVNLRINERIRETRSRSVPEQIRQRSVDLERKLDTRRFEARSNSRKFSNKRSVKPSENSKRISINQRNLNSRQIINSEWESNENVRSRRIDENQRSYTNLRTISTNRRVISTGHSDRRTRSTFQRMQDSNRIQNLQKTHRDIDLNRMKNRFQLRVDYSRLFKNYRANEDITQSRLRITMDFSRKIAILGTVQTRRKAEKANMMELERRISLRTLTNRIDTISKISSIFNSTARENGVSVSRQRRMVPVKQFMNTNKPRKLHNIVSASKYSSSNVLTWDIYEYLSSRRGSFLSLCLNIMLGLAIIVASTDEKGKGFISRRMNPFVDCFFKCTTVH